MNTTGHQTGNNKKELLEEESDDQEDIIKVSGNDEEPHDKASGDTETSKLKYKQSDAGTLILMGKFTPGQMLTIYKQYLKEYVRCRNCNGANTEMKKERKLGLNILTCNDCNSTSTLTKIESGYVHVTKG